MTWVCWWWDQQHGPAEKSGYRKLGISMDIPRIYHVYTDHVYTMYIRTTYIPCIYVPRTYHVYTSNDTMDIPRQGIYHVYTWSIYVVYPWIYHVSSGNLTTWLILVYTCIYWDVLRTSWVLRCYRRTRYENQGNRITRYILTYLEIYFWPKVYLRIFGVQLLAVQLSICPYISVWNFQIKYILVYPEYMPVYTCTADFLSWMRGHILVHSLTSEYIRCATAFSCLRPAGRPAPCWPASTLRAHLILNAAHSWQKQDKFVQEQISSLLFLPPSGSPVAPSFSAAAEPSAALAARASCSERDSDVAWATNSHFTVVARGRAPGLDLLYPPSCQVEDVLVVDRCNDGSFTVKDALWWCWVHNTWNQLYFSHSAFERSAIIEENQNWSCAAMQKEYIESVRGFPTAWHHLIFPWLIDSIQLFSNQQILLHKCIEPLHLVWQCRMKTVKWLLEA